MWLKNGLLPAVRVTQVVFFETTSHGDGLGPVFNSFIVLLDASHTKRQRKNAEVERYSRKSNLHSFVKSPFPRGIRKNLFLPLHLYRIRALNPGLHLVRLALLLERPPAVAVKLNRHLRLQRDAPAGGGNSTRPPPVVVAVGSQYAPVVAVRVLQQVLDGLLGPRLAALLALLDVGEEGRRAA